MEIKKVLRDSSKGTTILDYLNEQFDTKGGGYVLPT